MASDTGIVIRRCESLDDFRQCVAVQQAVWGFDDRDLIPVRMFVVAQSIEGQILGAFEPSGRLVGFSLAVPALKGSTVYLHSHMLGLLAEYRRQGLGRRLKFEQRREALERGINLIEWTFDPLELKNASFNLERLGAIVRCYRPNVYGLSSSRFQRGLPTDRLVAEWWLNSERVIARATEKTAAKSSAHPGGAGGMDAAISRRITVPLTSEGAVAGNIDIDKEGPAALQAQLREQFQQAFAAGLAVVGFEFIEEKGAYLLGRIAESNEPA